MPGFTLGPGEMDAALDFAGLAAGSPAIEAATWLLRATSLPGRPEFGQYVTIEQDSYPRGPEPAEGPWVSPGDPGKRPAEQGPPAVETLWLARPDWPRLGQHLDEFGLDERERTLLQLAISYAAGVPVALGQALGLEAADAKRVVEACLIAQGLERSYAQVRPPAKPTRARVVTPHDTSDVEEADVSGELEDVMAWHAATPEWTLTAGRLVGELSRLDPATEVVLIGDAEGNGGTRRVATRVRLGTFFPAWPDSWHGHFCEKGQQCLHDDEAWGLDLDASAGQVSAVRIEPVN